MGHGGHAIGSHATAQFFGYTFNMDTLYMTWLAMAIVIVIAVLAVRRLETVPRGLSERLRDRYRGDRRAGGSHHRA